MLIQRMQESEHSSPKNADVQFKKTWERKEINEEKKKKNKISDEWTQMAFVTI